MTSVSPSDNPLNSQDREYDDLTRIKGIGPARQKWLRKSLNVYTFRDLAALSANVIESRLKAEGQIASRPKIEQWITQAQEFTVTAESTSPQVVEPMNSEDSEVIANSPAAESEWKPFASFVVEFQARQVEGQVEEQRTTVHHVETDTGEAWFGLESEQLCQWMVDQVDEKKQPESEEKHVAQAPPAKTPLAKKPVIEGPSAKETPPFKAPPPVTVESTQIRAFLPPEVEAPSGIGEAGQPFAGFITSGEPCALEVAFELPEPAAADLAQRQVTYSAQFHIHNLATGASMHLGNTEPNAIEVGKTSYTARLPEAILQPGMYRLGVLVILQSTPPSANYLEIPLLQVV